jgi:peroxiredoxin
MKTTPLLLAGVLALAFTGALLLSSNSPLGKRGNGAAGVGTLAQGAMAPAFTLKDVSGNVVESTRFSGKPTVLNFFATWCPACVEEIPGFVDVYNKYRDRGLELVGISLDTDTRKELPAFVMHHRIGYRILLGDLDTTRAFGGVSSLPTTVFIGKDGTIRAVHVGYLDRETFDREVKKLL